VSCVDARRKRHVLGERTKAATRSELLGGQSVRTVDPIQREEVAFLIGAKIESRVAHTTMESWTRADLGQMDVVVPLMKGADVGVGGEGRRDYEKPIRRRPLLQGRTFSLVLRTAAGWSIEEINS
jgi:hypothetical protein